MWTASACMARYLSALHAAVERDVYKFCTNIRGVQWNFQNNSAVLSIKESFFPLLVALNMLNLYIWM